MGMLGSLLPGVRDLRTPLVSGYVWLFALWVGLGNLAPVHELFGAIKDALSPVALPMGATATIAGTTLLAYIIGCIWEVDAALLNRGGFARLLGPAPKSHIIHDTSFQGTDAERLELVRLTRKKRMMAYDVELLRAYGRVNPDYSGFDPRTVAIRLHKENKDLWDQYDRLSAEAEFRMTIAFPLTLAAISVAFRTSQPLAALPILYVALVLYRRGDWKARKANGILVQAVVTGQVEGRLLSLDLS